MECVDSKQNSTVQERPIAIERIDKKRVHVFYWPMTIMKCGLCLHFLGLDIKLWSARTDGVYSPAR